MNANYWWNVIRKKRLQPVSNQPLAMAMITKKLEESFKNKNFKIFTQAIEDLTKAAANRDSEAMQLLSYLKRQVNPSYHMVAHELLKLSGGRHFTEADFERLVEVHGVQQEEV
jgi:hypothetical protein